MRNELKIVCNPYTKQISYYFRNEMREWEVLSGDSELSRQYYKNTTMRERAKAISEKADEIYNRKNKGLDILFEGESVEYNYLQGAIDYYLKYRDIRCQLGTTKIAVIGKKAVGKTILIKKLQEMQRYKYSKEDMGDYTIYQDELNHAKWYEVAGIDLGIENVRRAFYTIEKISQRNLSTIIYCISAETGRIETIERDLIQKIIKNFPETKVMIVLTMCYKEDIQPIIDEIEKITNHIKIIPVLAEDYRTGLRNGFGKYITVESFGIDVLSKYIFNGR